MEINSLLAKFKGVTPEHDGWVAVCPAHTDSHPSLRITVANSKGLMKCRAGCETSDVLFAVGLTFADLSGVTGTVDLIQASSPLTDDDLAQVAAFVSDNPLSEAAETYAKARFGVSSTLAALLKLGAYSGVDGERLLVPFCTPDGQVVGWQARALSNDARVRWLGARNPSSGGTWSKVGYFPGGNGVDEVIVCEGPGDALTAAGAGFDSIAIRGAAMSDVAPTISEWVGQRRVVVIGDGDPAGEQFASRMMEALLALGVNTATLPMRSGTDIADWYAENPAAFAGNFIRFVTTRAKSMDQTYAIATRRNVDRFPLTDLGNANYAAFIASCNNTPVRFCPQLGWLIADRGVWLLDELDEVRSIVQAVAEEIKEIADANAGDKEWAGWAKYSQSATGISNTIREMKALRHVSTPLEAFDRHKDLLAVANGIINLRTGEFFEPDEGLMLTRRLNVSYDADAPAPLWEKFLSDIMSDDVEMVDYLQRLVGYGITGRTDEQCFAVLWGTGANGKTVFTATLSHVFNAITTNTPFSTFEVKSGSGGSIPNDVAALRGARLVMAAEGEADKPMAEALLKRLTGRDPITARFLHKEYFTFYPNFLMMLATNNKPAFRGQDEGLWRRVKMVKFDRFFTPEERDHRIQDKLEAEAPGILAWAVRGSMKWFEQGLDDPQKIKEATGDYRINSDPLVGFLPGMYIKDVHSSFLKGSQLFNDYLNWTSEENLNPREIVTRKKFFAMLEERGYPKRVGGKDRQIVFDFVRRSRPTDEVRA